MHYNKINGIFDKINGILDEMNCIFDVRKAVGLLVHDATIRQRSRHHPALSGMSCSIACSFAFVCLFVCLFVSDLCK